MTTAQRLTFEDYLSWDDGTDKRYELVDGMEVVSPGERNRQREGDRKRRQEVQFKETLAMLPKHGKGRLD